MRNRIMLRFFLAFFIAGIFNPVWGEDRLDLKSILERTSKEIMGKSLIRTELLLKRQERLKSPKRNIFAPRKEQQSEVPDIPEDVKARLKKYASGQKGKVLEATAESNIRYIGYVTSGERTVALIIYEEEVLAVEEGEAITDELKVGRITLKDIEIIGPDSNKKKYVLEGEEE